MWNPSNSKINVKNKKDIKSTTTSIETSVVVSSIPYKKEKQLFKSKTTTIENCLHCNEFDQFTSADYGRICLCELTNHSNTGIISNHHRTPQEHSTKSMFFDNPGQIYNYINRCRKWIKVWEPRNLDMKRNEFSLTTYNILAQNLLLNHLYLYQDNNKSDLEWLERSTRLKQELIELNSDIFCLQEVHLENFTTSILPSLKERGYQMISKKKTGQNHDGCSILFKKSKFQLQDSLEIQMNRLDVSHLLDRDQVALVVKLRPVGRLSTNKETNLIIANTHLIFNPRRGDIKLAQLRLLLAEIQRFAIKKKSKNKPKNGNPFKLDYFPIILCGDFNSEPKSPLIKFIETGQLNIYGLRSGDISGQREGLDKGLFMKHDDIMMNGIDSNSCYITSTTTGGLSNVQQQARQKEKENADLTIRHVFNLKSVYPTVDKFNVQLISTSTYMDCGLVDHLFYSNGHRNLHLSAYKQLINKQNLRKIGNIPNSILGSDHISLSAKFYFT